jgi:DNA invertase Pin-like site-specific DNA recombinase
MTKVVLYLRASTPEQNTFVQRQMCQQYIEDNRYTVINTIDEKRSAYNNTHRRALFKFIQNLANEEPFDKLVIYSYDRFSRNIIDALEMVRYLDEFNITLESVIDNIDYSTPDGRKKLAEKFILTQYESDINSFRSKANIAYRRQFNINVTTPPFGQKIEPVKRDKIIKNEEEVKIMEFIKCAKQGGLTSDELTVMMNSIRDLCGDRIGVIDEDDEIVNPTRPMSYREISDILNSCEVKKRKRSWTPSSVAHVAKRKCVL